MTAIPTKRFLVTVGLLLAATSYAFGLALSPASAQGIVTSFERLQIALWPEYDRPATLVIYRFRLSLDTPLPAIVELPIPAAVGQPHAVAWQDSSAALFDAPHTQTIDGAWALIQIEMEESRLGQIEYYADVDLQGDERSFSFAWPGNVTVGALSYEIQQPVGATGFTVTPPPDSEGAGPFGLNYLSAELGPLSEGERFTIDIRYQKSNELLTVELLQPLGEPAAPATAESGANGFLPWVLAGGGALLVAGGVLYYARGRSRPAPPRRKRPPPSETEIEASAVFCHHCGTKAQVNDVFCRNCGTRLRRQ